MDLIYGEKHKKAKKKEKEKKKDKLSILDEFDEMDQMESSFPTIGSYKPDKEEKKNKVEEMQASNEMGDDWLKTIANFKQEPIKARKQKSEDSIFDYIGGKKKKKKKKDKEGKEKELVDYNVVFEPEVTLMKNLLSDQTQFTQSLQRRYDILDSSKSSARGVGKFTTDLIQSVNQARTTSMQLIDRIASLKKTAIDLNMKEKKEAGALVDGNSPEELNQFSADFLKKIIRTKREDLSLYDDGGPMDGTADDIFANIEDEMRDSERSGEVDAFLKYEKRGVEVIAKVDPDDYDKFRFEAVAADGEILDDYPLPEVTSLEINRSTGYASDEFHTKYKIEFESQ